MGSRPIRTLRLVWTGALGAAGRSARAGWRAGGQKWRTVGWTVGWAKNVSTLTLSMVTNDREFCVAQLTIFDRA